MNRFIPVVAASFVAVATSGCTIAASPPVAYAEVDAVPADIEIYPHTYYEGRAVYFVNDRWYYRDGGRWAYYRDEPTELHRQRRYIQTAPRARRPERYPHHEHDHDRDDHR